MLKRILIGIGLLLLLVAGVIASRPATFKVERSASIGTTPEVLYSFVSDFHRWADFSPWEKLDPTMKRDFSGAGEGLGAIYAWEGDDKVGVGKMTITGASVNAGLVISLEVVKPMPSKSTTTFILSKDGDNTKVTWATTGTSSLRRKATSLFIDLDGKLGADFERGLAALKIAGELEAKSRVEAARQAAATDLAVPAGPVAVDASGAPL